MGYILGEKPEGCIFCTKPKENRDAENLILHRRDRCYTILNAFPYNNGHLMVVPYQHAADLSALAAADLAEMMVAVKAAVQVIQQLMHPDGFNVGLNLGRAAGAGIDEHLHLHVVPRWSGDTNFMPTLGAAKVIPQSLGDCYELLAPALAQVEL
jgi:ATP adenylyltransferase